MLIFIFFIVIFMVMFFGFMYLVVLRVRVWIDYFMWKIEIQMQIVSLILNIKIFYNSFNVVYRICGYSGFFCWMLKNKLREEDSIKVEFF